MPAMPREFKKLNNGIYTFIAASVETKDSKYGSQEEITCNVVDEPEASQQRVWITHASYKKVKAAIDAGLASYNPNTNEWHVIIGARFTAIIENGKVVNILPVQNGRQMPDQSEDFGG